MDQSHHHVWIKNVFRWNGTKHWAVHIKRKALKLQDLQNEDMAEIAYYICVTEKIVFELMPFWSSRCTIGDLSDRFKKSRSDIMRLIYKIV